MTPTFMPFCSSADIKFMPITENETPHRLHDRVVEDLRWLGAEPANWVRERVNVDHDVLIVGGGHSGLAIAHALRRAGIHRTTVVEAQPPERTSTWRTKARMRNLRTAKSNLGPELGIPSLTFQAWYEATVGRDAYEALARIPTEAWKHYIGWLAETTGVVVRNGTRLVDIAPDGDRLCVRLEKDGTRVTESCRKIVLATGISGSGAPLIPDALTSLPASLVAHTDSAIDFSSLRDRTVAIVGAASSAFDAAGTALEAGARAVHLFSRAERLAPSSNMSTLSYPGAQENFHSLPDAARWHLAWHFRERSPGPTPEVVARASAYDHFHLHLGSNDLQAREVARDGGSQVEITSQGNHVAANLVIAGTGYRSDLRLRPELASVAPHILRWADRDAVPADQRDRANALSPYLGAGYEFQPRERDGSGRHSDVAWVRHIHCFNFAAITSFGRHVGDIGSLKEGVPRLVRHLAQALFLDDLDYHMERLTQPVTDELAFADYARSVVKRGAAR